ncbi:HTH domain-containing protein [Asaia siamensis]
MARPALDRARIDPVISALRKQGVSAPRIARSLGISERAVHYAMRRLTSSSAPRKAA